MLPRPVAATYRALETLPLIFKSPVYDNIHILGNSFSLKFQCIRLMVFAVVILFVCLAYGGSAKFQDTDLHSADLPKTAVDYLLCRYCGSDISPLSSINSIDCPSAIKRRISQIFGLKDVKVQTVKNPLHLQFEIITLSKTLCIGEGNWHTEDSWFPGYAWKVCVCAKCGRHIGWMFEPLHLATSDKIYVSKEGFYVVIISSVINELHADSLIVIPKHFSTNKEIII